MTLRYFISLILCIGLLNVGCTTVCNKKKSIEKVIRTQNKVLKKLKTERSREIFKKELNKNPKLRKAEMRLDLAMNRLRYSNKKILRALKRD